MQIAFESALRSFAFILDRGSRLEQDIKGGYGGGVGCTANYLLVVKKLVVLRKTRSLATHISKFTLACIRRVTEPKEEFRLSEMCG